MRLCISLNDLLFFIGFITAIKHDILGRIAQALTFLVLTMIWTSLLCHTLEVPL